MRLIPLDKLQASTPAERMHGVIVVRQRPDGSYGVVSGQRCFKVLRELQRSGLIPTDSPVQCLVLDDESRDR